tara:strand:- start:10053 stop:12011 length:1959 start_codon:yes stop_codon:yes gene_type:complete
MHGVLMCSKAFLLKKWIFLLLCLSLAACGGSKNFDLPEELKDTTDPLVESILPDDETSDNFEIDSFVEIIFSELMNENSLTSEEGIKLFSGNSEQDSTEDLEPRSSLVSFSVVPLSSVNVITGKEEQIPATKLRLTHASGRFALNTSYSVIMDKPTRDLVIDDTSTDIDERNYITSASVVGFTTQKGNWKTVKPVPNISIENEGAIDAAPVSLDKNQFSPSIISNSKGDTFILWRQESSPGITQLWATRYQTNDKKWSSIKQSDQLCEGNVCSNATQLNTENLTSVLEYSASINEKGQLAVAWSQAKPSEDVASIWAKLYDGEKWLELTNISDTGTSQIVHADSPKIEIDSKGNAVSIWREHEGQYSRIKTNIFKLDSNSIMEDGQWTEAPSFIDNLIQVNSRPPELSLSKKGLAIAVWAQQEPEDNFHIQSNHLRLNQSNSLVWVGSQRIDLIDSSLAEYEIGDSTLPKIAIDQNSDAIALWLKHDGDRNNLWYSRFTGSWGAAEYLERDRLGDADYPTITYSQSNIALASWTQEIKSTNLKNLMTSFFNVNSEGWEEQEIIASSATLVKPFSSFDREGNAMLMWQSGLTKGDVKVSYYSKLSKSWESALTLGSNANDAGIVPLFEDGRFLSVWENETNSSFKLNSVLFSD